VKTTSRGAGVVDLITGADNQTAGGRPARLMLFFDGDRARPPEQMLMETAHLLTGQELPFATLMYVWENRFSQTLLRNTTQQVNDCRRQGRDRIGTGRHSSATMSTITGARSAPSRALVGIGIMTDNTGERWKLLWRHRAEAGALGFPAHPV
jgi:hypothetical protein